MATRLPAYVVFVCREIVDQEELNTYWQRVNGTLVGQPARVLIDRGRLLILEGQGPVEEVALYEFPSRDAARSWYDSVAYREVRQHRKKGCKVSGNFDRRRSAARRATDAAHQSRGLNNAPVNFSIIVARRCFRRAPACESLS